MKYLVGASITIVLPLLSLSSIVILDPRIDALWYVIVSGVATSTALILALLKRRTLNLFWSVPASFLALVLPCCIYYMVYSRGYSSIGFAGYAFVAGFICWCTTLTIAVILKRKLIWLSLCLCGIALFFGLTYPGTHYLNADSFFMGCLVWTIIGHGTSAFLMLVRVRNNAKCW